MTVLARSSASVREVGRSFGGAVNHWLPPRWLARHQDKLPDIFMVGALLVAGWKFSSGTRKLVDIGFDDESTYLTQGIDFLHSGLPSADNAPLYAVWYSLLARIYPDGIVMYFLNYRVLTVLPPILLYVLLRRHHVSLVTASAAALFILISNANFPVWPKVNHFALIVVLVSLILAGIPKSRALGFAILAFGCLVAAYVRPEMYYVFWLCFAISSVLFLVRERSFPNIVALLLVAVVAVAVGESVGSPLGARSLSAFGQHFSLNWQSWTNDTSLSSWTDWQQIMDSNFGQVNSIADALTSNPAAFMHHVATNAINLPDALASAFAIHASIFLPFSMRNFEAYVLLGVVIVWLLLRRRTILPQAQIAMRTNGPFLVHVCIISSMYLITCLLIYPRSHYLLIPGTLIFAAMVVLFDPLRNRQIRSSQVLGFALVLVAITPNVMNLVGPPPHRQPNLNAIQYIRDLDLTGDTHLLSQQFGYSSYLPRDVRADPGASSRAFAGWSKNQPFGQFVREHGINIIVVTDDLLKNSRFRDDTEWKAFLKNYENAGFVKFVMPDDSQSVYVDKAILPAGR